MRGPFDRPLDSLPQAGWGLADDLAQFKPSSLVTFNNGGYNYVQRQFITRSGAGTFDSVTTKHGPAMRFGDASGTTYATIPVVYEETAISAASAFSLVWCGSIPASGTAVVIRDSTSSAGTILVWSNAGFDLRIGGTDIAASGTFSTETLYCVVVLFSNDGRGVKLYVNGALVISAALSPGSNLTSPWVLHKNGTSAQGINATTVLFSSFGARLPDDIAREISANPGRLFEPQRIYIPVAAAGSVTGTLATTNANDTSAASGTTTVVGTLATTNAADTSAASGTVTVVGTLATTNAADTSAASGTVGDVTGTLATTNAADTNAASGTTTIIATLATTNANDTAAASGTAGSVTGTAAVTNADDYTAEASSFVRYFDVVTGQLLVLRQL